MAADAFNQNGVKEDYDPFNDDDNKDWAADGGNEGMGSMPDSDSYHDRSVKNVKVDSVVAETSLTAGHESNSMMRRAFPVQYDFIPSDDKYLNNEGECVVDQIDKIYGHLNNNLSRDNFINQCDSIENANLDNLDLDKVNSWDISQGVRTSTLNTILKKHNISYYVFDILNKCFDKNISTSRNYPVLVYYSVNNHMYWVGDKDKALGLTRKARAMETKIKSEMIVSYVEDKNIYLDEENKIKPIFENVDIEYLMEDQYNNSIVIYNRGHDDNWDPLEIYHDNKHDLFHILHDIIKYHNYIPTKIKHDKHAITRIIFEKEERNIILTIDINHNNLRELNYKDLIKLCNTHKIEFRNQTFGALVQEIRREYFDDTCKRIKFTKAKREELYIKFNKKCNCCAKELTIKETQIDHVQPLASGGTNDDINLQVLCRECHFEKNTRRTIEPRIC